MPLKKLDCRIRTLVENSVSLRHRAMFVLVGDRGRDQVVILHHMMSKAVVKARPSVLWCYKKELGFSSHRKKRMKQLQKKLKSGSLEVKDDDPFELFIAATDIRYCYYSETHKILGNTYGMCVLQDFEALTPNLLARTVETVEGGGLVVILLRTMQSLRQLCTMAMDVHARYRTEAHQHVVARFNERFLLSLADCSNCIVLDDQLQVLPISSHVLSLAPVPQVEEEPVRQELEAIKESLADTQPVGQLVNCCKTLDQVKALLKIVEAASEQTLRSTVTLTAPRGRGKSATLGLAIAAAVAFGYSNIFVTSPSPENLRTLFEFVFKGFDSVQLKEHEHYEIIQSTNPEFNHAVVRVNVFQQHRQTIQYINPADSHKLEQAELVCIDEAAAIPLPLVKKLIGPYLIFMASTINGYEGTGRSLSLKLIEDLRRQSVRGGGRVLREISLAEPIRYASCDPVEAWLHQLLCLDAGNLPRSFSGCPPPNDCSLYYVNRDTLFCYHKASEAFLQQLMSLYVSSHYKNSPNDLQLLSDAPAHHIFVLLGPVPPNSPAIPTVLCVLQVCLEGAISKGSVMNSLSRGKRAAGDLIPWTLSQQFADHDFAQLSGVRIVRIATHPDFQRMGYGTRAMQLLIDYYSGRICSSIQVSADVEVGVVTMDAESTGLLHEVIAPRQSLPPLLSELGERKPESLDYVGVCFGLTSELLRFWSQKNHFVAMYLRQTANELTGEHSCIMLRPLTKDHQWLNIYSSDFTSRYLTLLSYQFRSFSPSLALGLLKMSDKPALGAPAEDQPSYETMASAFQNFSTSLKRLEQYSRNMSDYHVIIDLLPAMANLYFTGKVNFKLGHFQAALLLGLGLQHKTVSLLHDELGKDVSQLLGQLNRIVAKFVSLFKKLEEDKVSADLASVSTDLNMEPTKLSLNSDLCALTEEKQSQERTELLKSSLAKYAVSGKEEDWADVLGGEQDVISVKKMKLSAGKTVISAKTNTKRKKVKSRSRQ